MKHILHFFLLALIVSCNKPNSTLSSYFGGEIINPKSNHVLLLKDDKVIDSLHLNSENRFLGTYVNLEEGLYTFKHGVEFQYVYLVPNDSVLIRLNSWDFDESLVFGGKGGAKNEFLINLFLQNEKEEKLMYAYFKLNEADFEHKTDSLINERNKIYNEFIDSEKNTTEGFEQLTKAAIEFPIFRLKEIYPYYYKKEHKQKNFPELSDGFYNFRKTIDLNNSNLISFYPYQNYVVSYLYHLSYVQKEENPEKSNISENILNLIAEKITNEEFKNNLLKQITINDFLKSERTCTLQDKLLQIFRNNCTNKEYVNEVNNLVNDSKAVANESVLPNFEIQSYTNITNSIFDVIKDRNTVIYFWSTQFMSSEYLVKRIQFLETNYPNILFIGINMQSVNEKIATEPNLKQLDITKQFLLTKQSSAHQFLTSHYPRTIIVSKDGIVKNGFTYLNSRMLNSELDKIK